MSNKQLVALYPYKDNENSFLIGDFDEENQKVNYKKVPKLLFKYCSLSAAKAILNNQALLFSVPTVFPDKREGALYEEAMNHFDKESLEIDDFFTCCFTMAKVSEAFTQNYSANSLYAAIYDFLGKGSKLQDLDIIGNSIGVCFIFNRAKFRKCLLKTLADKKTYENFKLIEGKMRYFSKRTIDKDVKIIPEQQSQIEYESTQNELFDQKFCQLMVEKNNNFIHENEYRYFVGLKNKQNNNNTQLFSIDFNNCLENIFIYANQNVLQKEFHKTIERMKCVKSELQEICDKKGIIPKIETELSNLYSTEQII